MPEEVEGMWGRGLRCALWVAFVSGQWRRRKRAFVPVRKQEM